ncbi:MAG: hypothetical protein RBT78_00975 [Kiritimatiellia bacterium]|jgi:hypothetical protein|nr:hypothetical protein [Kiritimatiellia bacterium]
MNSKALIHKNNLVKGMVVFGLLQVAAYYVAGSLATDGVHLAVPQPDTLLYCQSAQRVAEGHPFVYTPGDRPSTGSTSHLYPFVLGLLYKLGAKGDALLTAGFALNALFYLLFLAAWAGIIGRFLRSPRIRAAACALVALSGQAAYSALSQSDAGLFMALSSGLLFTLLSGRMAAFAVLLGLSPWCRPEGVLLSVLFAAALAFKRWGMRQRVTRLEGVAGLTGLLSSAGLFVFNYGLTGYVQFQSVIHKGYAKQYDFLSALHLTLGDTVRILRELLLGLPDALPRESFYVPLLGALCAWVGLVTLSRRRGGVWKEVWWLAACAAGVGVVASSGWQNTNVDRYLAWLLPVWLVYTAAGALRLGWGLGRTAACRWGPLLIVAAFQALNAAWLVTMYHTASLITQPCYEFAKEAHARLPPGARIGGVACNLAYGMPGRTFVHLSGLYSPDWMTPEIVTNLERLKHHPERRFDYWALPSAQTEFGGSDIAVLCGPVAALGVDEIQMRQAVWSPLDGARAPHLAGKEVRGWRLADRLDVGYAEDERRCAFAAESRYHGVTHLPFAMGTNTLFDVGRVVVGWVEFTPQLTPGKPVRVIVRTAERAETEVRIGVRAKRQTFSFVTPLQIRVKVDGADAGVVALPLAPLASAPMFCEASFELPAGAVRQERPQITLYGDHAAFGYWFYQPE